MTTALGNAVLMTRRGEGHTTLVEPTNRCLANAIAGYLIDLWVPRSGLAC